MHPSPHRPRHGLMVTAVWCGLAAAGLELLSVTILRTVFHQFAFVGRDVWWTVPLVNVAIFGAVGGALSVAASTGGESLWWRAGVWACAFLGCLAALLPFTLIHRAAIVLAAAGAATQFTRLAVSRRAPFDRFVRRTLPWLAVAAIAAGVAVRGSMWWHERSALAALPPPAADAPNVLLIVLDTVRAANLSLYGYARETTPHLERRAAGGAVFTEAFSTAPWTLPSHASMLTGRWEPEMSTDWMRPLDDTDPTLAEALAGAGYATGAFVANTDYASAEVGLGRGFARFEDYTLSAGQIVRSSALARSIDRTVRRFTGGAEAASRKHAPEISDAFLAWTNGRREPWFVLLNYYDAHRPYQPPEPFYSRFASGRTRPDPRLNRDENPDRPWTAEDGERFQVAYDGALAYLDSELEALFQVLERRGDLDRTLVIVTSDHGEEFGEHRLWDHGNSLYLPSVHVPLVVFGGHVPAGAVVRTPVSLRDIPATVLDLVGRTERSPFPGESLSRFWRDTAAPDDEMVVSAVRQTPGHPAWYPVSRGALIGLAQQQFRYIRNDGDGAEELFDFRADPWERRDLAADPESRPMLERFRDAAMRLSRRAESAE